MGAAEASDKKKITGKGCILIVILTAVAFAAHLIVGRDYSKTLPLLTLMFIL